MHVGIWGSPSSTCFFIPSKDSSRFLRCRSLLQSHSGSSMVYCIYFVAFFSALVLFFWLLFCWFAWEHFTGTLHKLRNKVYQSSGGKLLCMRKEPEPEPLPIFTINTESKKLFSSCCIFIFSKGSFLLFGHRLSTIVFVDSALHVTVVLSCYCSCSYIK